MDDSYENAISLIHEYVHEKNGKLVTSGMGKAGQIALNIATTFSSTGTCSVYLHPSEAQHGDLGILKDNDVLLLLSNSGKTKEIVDLISLAKVLCPNIKIICITGKPESELAQGSDVCLLTGDSPEICPLGLTPTTSTTLMTIIGDMLVVALDIIVDFISKNPLGSGSGFGSNIDINREFTTRELGLKEIQKNSLYCQNSRGKFELKYVHSLLQLMLTLQKLATDFILYTSREFEFFKVNDSITTGSSMMPQKKNLDVAEIIRGQYSMMIGLETQISTLCHGLISGYNRDFQLIKAPLVESYEICRNSVSAMYEILKNIEPNEKAILAKMNDDIYATDIAIKISKETGKPFRDVYKNILKKEKLDIDFDEVISLRKSLGSPGNY